jgi:hypothetical protein
MASTYNGVDAFSNSLSLITDNDPPHAAPIRLPSERLLDNDVHLRNRASALEGIDAGPRLANLEAVSNVAGLVTTTGVSSAVFLASKTLAAGEAVAGTRWRYSAQIQVARGATATATNASLRLTLGAGPVFTIAHALNTTPGYTGTLRFEGEISFLAAPGPAAAFTATCVATSTVASATPVIEIPTPSLVLTGATDAPFAMQVLAFMSVAVAGVSFTPVSGQLHRLRS